MRPGFETIYIYIWGILQAIKSRIGNNSIGIIKIFKCEYLNIPVKELYVNKIHREIILFLEKPNYPNVTEYCFFFSNNIYICVGGGCLPTRSARAGCDTRSILKQILTGFNSEFSFSESGRHTRVKDPSLP